jgi:hypothetical protein
MNNIQHLDIFNEIKVTRIENQEQTKTITQEVKASEEQILKGEKLLEEKIDKQEVNHENQFKLIHQEMKAGEVQILRGEQLLIEKFDNQGMNQESQFKSISQEMEKIDKLGGIQENHHNLTIQGIDAIYKENMKENNMLETIGEMIQVNEEGLHHINNNITEFRNRVMEEPSNNQILKEIEELKGILEVRISESKRNRLEERELIPNRVREVTEEGVEIICQAIRNRRER